MFDVLNRLNQGISNRIADSEKLKLKVLMGCLEFDFVLLMVEFVHELV